MRRDVQEIFRVTPHHKQVMMFSATLAKEIRATCKKFMTNVSLFSSSLLLDSLTLLQPLEIFVDDETKLTLHGLQQYYVKLEETGKNRKLNDLLDTLDFNQVGIFNAAATAIVDFLAGRHLRQVGCSGERIGQASQGMQFPEYYHSLGHAPG